MTARAKVAKWVVLSTGMFSAGCSKGLTEKDVDRIVAERVPALVQKKLEEEKLIKPPSAGQATTAESPQPPYLASLAFLARLDALMDGYVPALSGEADSADLLRCASTDEIASNKDLTRAASSLRGKRKADDAAHARSLADAERVKWVQYRLDYNWADRIARHPTPMGCWHVPSSEWIVNGAAETSQSLCEEGGSGKFLWKARAAARPDTHLYSGKPVDAPDAKQMPELMKRIKSDGLAIPERFFCSVSDVTARDKTFKKISCAGEKPAGVSLRVSGAVPALHIGDVVSVPLKDAKRDPDGVLLKEKSSGIAPAWVIDADGASVKVESAATCPSVEEIVAAANKTKK